jgi:hypothetical protein
MALTTLYIPTTVDMVTPMVREKDSTGQVVNGIVNIVMIMVTHSIWKGMFVVCLKLRRIDINDENVIVATVIIQQGISSNIMRKVQGATPGAITAITAVTSAESENNTAHTQVSPSPTTALQQTRSETKQNTGDIYMSGPNWYCKHCKLSGDKFYMEVHICKGYIPI